MKKLQPLAAVCLSLVLAFALVPFGGTQALADEPLSEQNEGESGVTLEIDWVTPLSTNKIEIAFSITNNTDVSLPSTNMVGFYKRSITKSNFIIYRYIRIEVKPGTTVQRVDTVEAIGIGSVPLVLHLFDNGTTYPKVTPANLPIGDAAGHEATQSVNPAETVALSSFSVERVNSSAVTVTYTVTNTTPYEVSSGSFISFYKDSVDKENFLLKKTLPKAVPPGTSVTMTQTLSKTGIASERLVARLFDINSEAFPYVYPSPFADTVTENKIQYGAAFTTKIICVGDSITEGLGASNTYPEQLQNKLGDDYAVVNYGVSGRTANSSADLPYIETTNYQKAMDSNPDIVIIMLGSNDTKTLNWTDTRKTQFRTSYLELVRGFMNLPSAPQVYLATPVPVIWTSLRGIRESVLAEEIRPIIREVATELELPLIENEGLLPGGQGYYLVDRLHPSSKGYDLLSTHIMNSILAGGKL